MLYEVYVSDIYLYCIPVWFLGRCDGRSESPSHSVSQA